MQYHSQIIETAPMQIYLSAILFSPTESLVRCNFIEVGKLPSWITSTPAKDSHWSPCLQVIEAKNPLVDSRNMNLLILNEHSENVEIWDIASGQRIHVFNHSEIVRDAVFSSDSRHVLTVTSSQLIFWDILSGTLIRSINIIGLHGTSWVYKLSKDGKFLATYPNNGSSIQIYDMVEGTKFQLPLHSMFLGNVKWSNDSKFLYFNSFTFATLWDVARGAPKMRFDRKYSDLPTTLSFSEDSKLIAFVDRMSMGIVVWDLSRDEKVSTIVSDRGSKEITFILFSNDSTLLAVVNGSFVEVRDIVTGRRQHNLNFGTRHIESLTWSTDSEALAVIFRNSVEIYDLTESRYWDSMVHDTYGPLEITFSADSTLVATWGQLLKIWDSATGSEVRTIHRSRGDTLGHLLFSQNLKRICTHNSEYGLERWDIASGSLIPYSSEHPTGQEIRAPFSFDGRYFALVKDEIQLWSLGANNVVSHLITPKTIVDCLAFSNNAVYLVLVSKNIGKPEATIDVWRVGTGEKLWTVEYLTLHIEEGYMDRRCGACGSHRIPNQAGSIAISDDGMVLYVTPTRHEMVVWSEEKKMFKLSICYQYFEPYFDIESPYILTQFGRIHLDKLIAQAAESSHSEIIPDYQRMTEGYGIGSRGSWVTWNGKNILWLPPDYRPTTQRALSRRCIVTETTTKSACIISFSGPPPFDFQF